MKIICTDNYARETVADQLVAENVKPFMAALIVSLLNGDPARGHYNWYRAVEDDHKLWRGMEELV